MSKEGSKERQFHALRKLQEIDFVLLELNLYLDTHPQDHDALKQYNYYAQKRKKIAREYEAQYGPLRNFGQSYLRKPNDWTKSPWPWEI